MLKTAKQRGDIKSNEVYLGAERGFRRGQRCSLAMPSDRAQIHIFCMPGSDWGRPGLTDLSTRLPHQGMSTCICLGNMGMARLGDVGTKKWSLGGFCFANVYSPSP